MSGKVFFTAALLSLLFLTAATADFASEPDQLARVREATRRFKRIEVAQASGYIQVDGLDHCFNNPGVGGMGYHYIKTSALDMVVKVDEPEAMVYAPHRTGKLKLAAIEYIVPAAAWDAAGNNQPPTLLGQSFHLNESLGVYVLHAWIWQRNPAGMFEDWNPLVSCP